MDPLRVDMEEPVSYRYKNSRFYQMDPLRVDSEEQASYRYNNSRANQMDPYSFYHNVKVSNGLRN